MERGDGWLFQNHLGNPVTRNEEKRYRVKKRKKIGKDVHYGWKLLN